jgi:hypothetical protein
MMNMKAISRRAQCSVVNGGWPRQRPQPGNGHGPTLKSGWLDILVANTYRSRRTTSTTDCAIC